MNIYFHLSGRLGNQLFQWAYIHELQAQGHKVHVFIDKYHNTEIIDIELNRIMDECPHLQKIRTRNILGLILKAHEKLSSGSRLSREIRRVIPVYIEAESMPQNSILPIMIDGFFIDKKWPLKHSEVLLKEFRSLKNRMLEKNQMVNEIATDEEKTVIHIRRGDLHLFKDTFGLLSEGYYRKIQVEKGPVYVLSDSVSEARRMFSRTEKFVFLDPGEIDVWAAVVVMSSSSQLFIGNSTLSWWGGYFAMHEKASSVTMPRPFYRKISKFDDQLYIDGFKTLDSDFE
jgi:hypothetical protein